MMDVITILITIGGICLLVGAAIGSLAIYLLSSRGSRQESKPEDNDVVVLARFLRFKTGGKVVPEIGGRKFHSSAEMSEVQRDNFSRLLNQMQNWLQPEREDSSQVKARPSIVPSAGLSTIAPLRPVANETAEPIRPLSMNPIDALARAIQSDVPKIPSASKSIAAQIDEILQENLAGTPLEKRGISLLDHPGQGVLVRVGLEQYDGIDAVPDPEIRELIRSAAAEWENRIPFE
jgi:hypothetical protein